MVPWIEQVLTKRENSGCGVTKTFSHFMGCTGVEWNSLRSVREWEGKGKGGIAMNAVALAK